MDRDSSVGIATRYGLHGPGIESRWGRDFPRPSKPSLRLAQPVVLSLFPTGTVAEAWSKKKQSLTLLPLWAFMASLGRILPLLFPFREQSNHIPDSTKIQMGDHCLPRRDSAPSNLVLNSLRHGEKIAHCFSLAK